MARPAKRAEVIAAAFLAYHSGEITLGELLACLQEMRDSERPL